MNSSATTIDVCGAKNTVPAFPLGKKEETATRARRAMTLFTSMLHLERSSVSYECPDYLELQRKLSKGYGQPALLNELWREKVCEWFYRVVDTSHGKLSRDVVYIAMSILDRFLASVMMNGSIEGDARSFYQISAMTSLYIGTKVHYRKGKTNCVEEIRRQGEKLSLCELLAMSTSSFSAEDIEWMEGIILDTLSYQVCPPTPSLFIRCLLALLPTNAKVSLEEKCEILESARFIGELSSFDYFFVGQRASTIAYASILMTVEELHEYNSDEIDNKVEILSYLKNIGPVAGAKHDSSDVVFVRRRLRALYRRSLENSISTNARHAESYHTQDTAPKISRVVSSEEFEN